jgi:hypothetical protein
MDKLLKQLIGKKIVNIEYIDIAHGNSNQAPMITLEGGIELIALCDPEGNGPGFITVSSDDGKKDLGGF